MWTEYFIGVILVTMSCILSLIPYPSRSADLGDECEAVRMNE